MKTAIALLGAISAFAVSASAFATVPVTVITPGATGNTSFSLNSTNSANLAITVYPTTIGTFTDDFRFNIANAGEFVTSGSVFSFGSSTHSSNYIDILSVTFNGIAVPIIKTTYYGPGNTVIGASEIGSLLGLAAAQGQNDLVVTFRSLGTLGSFQSNFQVAAVPEPASWALMLIGIGVCGFAMRRNQRSAAQPTYA